jgi:ArsR family transcriptional regulator
MTFASRNLTLDAQSQQESHVKWTSLCIEPNAKPLKLFNPQSQPKMPSDTRSGTRYFENHRNSLDVEVWAPYGISMKLEIAAKQLEALGNPTRLQVYRSLVRAGDAGMPVGQLQERIGIAASTLSHHLHRLILTGLVSQERQATTLICRANYPAMDELVGYLVNECCADAACAPAEAVA